MALFERKKAGVQIPSDGIELRRDQVAKFYRLVVDTWKPQYEIWALAYGPQILGAAGALSGIYGNMYFRRKLKLRQYGFVSTYIPNTILPFLLSASVHQTVTQNDIFMNPYGCSLCNGTKAAAIQAFFGLVQPLALVPASAFLFASRHYTYRLPSPIHNRKEFFKFCKLLYSPLKVPMAVNVGIQVMLAFFITAMEENHFFYMQNAMTKADPSDTLAA